MEVEEVKESHYLEDSDETAPQAKRAKLGGDNTTADDSITGASGASIIVPKTFEKRKLPTPTQKDVKPETSPEGKKLCVQCKEAYWEGFNWPRSCWFHDGNLALDRGREVWDNFDYGNEDELDTGDMREQVPEGFVYGCCGDSGFSRCCKWGSHMSNDTPTDAVPTDATGDTTAAINVENTKQTAPEIPEITHLNGETTNTEAL